MPPLSEKLGELVLNRTDVLVAANEAVQQRHNHYGKPEDNFDRIALLWNAYLQARREPSDELNSADVALMCALLKVARLANDPASSR